MAEYIKREDVKKLINVNFSGLLAAIDTIPAADVAPVVHGQWAVKEGLIENAICSKCGRHFQSYYEAYRFCPNCGAKMDGGDSDELL